MKILIKIGSALLSKGNYLDHKFLKSKIKEISELHKQGNEVIIVSYGAVACGMEIENLQKRPQDILELQLLSGEGQIELLGHYQKLFLKEGIKISQVLLTHHNFDTKKEKETIVNIINNYLKRKIIPIINENDLVSKEEFESNKLFSDNDILAALIAKEIRVDLIIILTDVDGLYSENPGTNLNATLIEEVKEITEEIKKIATKENNMLGLGGMNSKIIAAEITTKEGINTIIANGKYSISDILNNKVKRTLFRAKK